MNSTVFAIARLYRAMQDAREAKLRLVYDARRGKGIAD